MVCFYLIDESQAFLISLYIVFLDKKSIIIKMSKSSYRLKTSGILLCPMLWVNGMIHTVPPSFIQ